MWLPLRTRCSSFWLRQYLSSSPLEAKLRWASSGHQSHCSVCLVNPPHLCSAGGRRLVAAEAHVAPGSLLVLLQLFMTAEWTEPFPESSVRRSNWSWRWCQSLGHPHLPAPSLGGVGRVGGGGVWMLWMRGSWNNTQNLEPLLSTSCGPQTPAGAGGTT